MALLKRSGTRDPEARMTVVEHLEDLRRSLIVSVVGWFVCSAAAYGFWHPIYEFLIHRAGIPRAYFFYPTGGFMLGLKIALYTGVLGALPIVIWQGWRFVGPGLLPHEKRTFFPLTVATYVFFLMGVSAALFSLPLFIKILTYPGFFAPSNFKYLPSGDDLWNFVLLITIAFGLVFELPVVLYTLGRLGIVKSRWLYKHRVYWIIGLGLLANVMTPGADPITPLILFIPLWIFWEGTSLLLKLQGR